MDRSSWFEPKWRWLKRFALASIPGIALVIAGAIVELPLLIALGAFLIVPLLFWVSSFPWCIGKIVTLVKAVAFGAPSLRLRLRDGPSWSTGFVTFFQTGAAPGVTAMPSNNSFKPKPLAARLGITPHAEQV